MDEGAIIGLSPEVKIDYQGKTLEEYKQYLLIAMANFR